MFRFTVCGLLLALLSSVPSATLPASAQEEEPSLDYREAIDEALMAADEKDFKGAVKHYRKATKLAGKPTLETELGLAQAFNQLKAFKNGEECARRALELARDPADRMAAYDRLGVSLYREGNADQEGLEAAAEAFRQVLELSRGGAGTARYSLGLILLKMGRDEEGIAMLEEYLAGDAYGTARQHAQSLIDNPERARTALLPEFEVVTLDGEFVTSEDLLGKVVLLDFWGTWCPPCVDAVPQLRRLSKRSDKDPFVILSISTDDDESELRSFIVEHRMTWPQVWDERHELARTFGIKTYPSYLVVDHEGVVRFRHSGWSSRVGADLSRRILTLVRDARRAGG